MLRALVDAALVGFDICVLLSRPNARNMLLLVGMLVLSGSDMRRAWLVARELDKLIRTVVPGWPEDRNVNPLQKATSTMSLRQLNQHCHERHHTAASASRAGKWNTLDNARDWHRGAHGRGADHAHENADNG